MQNIEGSAAAPTAGLHFTPELLKQIEEKGIHIAHVTLHVGIRTFRPVKVEDVTRSPYDISKFYVVEQDTADLINETKKSGHRVIGCSAQQAAAHWNRQQMTKVF